MIAGPAWRRHAKRRPRALWPPLLAAAAEASMSAWRRSELEREVFRGTSASEGSYAPGAARSVYQALN